jgi:transcriptional regulator with XRE-family HTH domain
MSLQTKDAFIEWLDEMEDQRGWTDYRLSMETGLSSSVFSKARQGILPKWEALMRIAEAFHISPITAFRKAGLLPPDGGDRVQFADWQSLLDQLPEDEREDLRLIAEAKLQKVKKQKGLKKLNPQKAG